MEAFLIQNIYTYTKRISTLQEALANKGITLGELAIAMTQVQREHLKSERLRRNIQHQTELRNKINSFSSTPAPELKPVPHKPIEKILFQLYKKETRIIKKKKQLS